jgi:RNA polymerase sigma-70 factor (ECF subfamily)
MPRACTAWSRARHHADDLLQDVFLNAFRKMDRYRGESSLGTWLFRMATNQCLDFLRSRGHRNAQSTGEYDEAAHPIDAPAAKAGPVVGVIDRLDLERALAGLHDVEGFEHREIGEMLGIAEGTSKSQLHKARLRLRQALATGVKTDD